MMPANLETAIDRIESMLAELFPGLVHRIPSVPAFEILLKIHDGSARTTVFIVPAADGEFIVRTNAWVLTNPVVSFDLCADLLRRNARADLGAYYLSDEQHVGFAHSILGSAVDPNELRASIVAVATVADGDDDDLQVRYGGYRALDTLPST